MLEITMCANIKCKDKMQCFRFRAQANSYQSYALFAANKDEECESFMPIPKYVTLKPLDKDEVLSLYKDFIAIRKEENNQ